VGADRTGADWCLFDRLHLLGQLDVAAQLRPADARARDESLQHRLLGTTPFGAPLVGLLIAATNPRIGVFLGALLTLLTGFWLVLVLRQTNRRSLVLQST